MSIVTKDAPDVDRMALKKLLQVLAWHAPWVAHEIAAHSGFGFFMGLRSKTNFPFVTSLSLFVGISVLHIDFIVLVIGMSRIHWVSHSSSFAELMFHI